MPMYAGINGTVTEIPAWYAGINGVVHQITKFPVGINGTVHTIYLTSDVAITVTIQNQVTDGCFTNDSSTAAQLTKVLINDKTICLVPDQLCAGTFTDTEKIAAGSTFQIDIRFVLVEHSEYTDVYLNGDKIYTGGSKGDDSPAIMTLQANGSTDVVITTTGSHLDGTSKQVVEITGDVIATEIPPLPEGQQL